MWCFGEGAGWLSWFGGIWMFIIGGGLIAFIVWGISRFTRQESIKTNNKAIDLARERYAKGEINKEQFDEIKKNLFS